MKKAGTVVIIGRTNAGKSTLLNNLLDKKVAITSPKPKTTKFNIEAVYEDDRGQIVFIDTPGQSDRILSLSVDLVIYLIDRTRKRGEEENKTLGIVRRFKNIPKILVVNKIDIKKPDYNVQYLFLEDEFEKAIEISAIKRTNLKGLLNLIFSYLPERKRIVDTNNLQTPLLNMDSKTYIAEQIREKIFLFMGQEIPYHVKVQIEELSERKNGVLYVKACLLTDRQQYKEMLIGRKGRKIKQIGSVARKELELTRDKKVYLDLTVEVGN